MTSTVKCNNKGREDRKPLGKSAVTIPSIGMGTWGIGGYGYTDISRDKKAIEALQAGIELGMNLIDTAEIYGRGHSEEIVGEAIRIFPRDKVFIVSKVSEKHLNYKELINACRLSLLRLKLEYIDLYLIHFPNYEIPLSETMRTMEDLVQLGLVKFIGVSNFPLSLMKKAQTYLSQTRVEVNEVKYNVKSKYPEEDLLPFCQKENVTLMAYTPLEEGSLVNNKYLQDMGRKYGKTAAQIALNWLICHDHVVTIPKASDLKHVKENAKATGWRLKSEDFEEISKTFSI